MIRLSLPLSQFFDIFRLEEPRVPQAIDDRIYLVHDDALERQHVNQDVESVNFTVAVSSNSFTSFSIAEDHYLQAISLRVTSGLANLTTDIALLARPWGQADRVVLMVWDRTASMTLCDVDGTPREYVHPHLTFVPPFPLFGRRETDYFITGQAGAGGNCVTVLEVYRTQAVDGVVIAR